MGKIGDPTFLAIVLAAFVASCFAGDAKSTSNVSYAITTSDVLVPNSEFLIDLNLFDLVQSDSSEGTGKEPDECVLDMRVSVDDHLWHRSTWKIDLDGNPKSFSKTLKILISSDERHMAEKSILKIESNSCFKFSRSVEVQTGRRDLVLSLRTDKLNYCPGDIVWIEAFVFTADHRPYWKPLLNLSIYDSRGVLVVRWPEIIPFAGLVKERYLIPKVFKAKSLLIVLEIEGQQVNHTVTVEHLFGPYAKKFFQVEVTSPEYVTVDPSNEGRIGHWNICVIANDNYGIPIVGRVSLNISLKNESEFASLAPLELHGGHRVVSLQIDEIKEMLKMEKDESLIGHEIQVRVTVDEIRPSRGERKSEDDDVEEEEVTGDDEKKGEEGNEEQKVVVSVVKDLKVKFVNQSLLLFFGETSLFFKPGLSYVGHILLKPIDELASIGLSPEKEIIIIIKHLTTPSGEPYAVQNFTMKLPLDSFGEFSFKTHQDDVRLDFEAFVMDEVTGQTVRAHLKNIQRFSAEHEKTHYIQVMFQDSTVKMIGQEIKVVIETSFPSDEVSYFLFSDQSLLLSGRTAATFPSTRHELSLVVPRNVSHYVSTPDLLVRTVAPNKEMIADSLRFVLLEPQGSELELSVDRQTAEPGSKVEVLVRGEPQTQLFLFVAAHVLPFQSKELERQKLIAYERVKRYLHTLNSDHFGDNIHVEYCVHCTSKTTLATDSMRLFNDTGVLLLMDGILFENPENHWPIQTEPNGTLGHLRSSTLDSIGALDGNFWNSTNIGTYGEVRFKLDLPMAAKLYTISVVGVRPGKDVMVVDEPIQVLASSKVLASLRHPKTVVRGEEFAVEVNLFNNQDKEAKVEVSLKPRSGVQLSKQNVMNKSQFEKEIVLKAMHLEVIQFHVETSPTAQEPLDFQVDVVSDEVHHKLTSSVELKYEGYEVLKSENLLLDNFNGEQGIEVDVPKNITNPIEMSERAHVKIYGHPLGPAIEHVCKNLKKDPRERRKVEFPVAVNVLEHISNNSLFDDSVHVKYEDEGLPIDVSLAVPTDREECVQSIRDSLQYPLNERRDDGSYSFYPDKSGYIRLTSLMLDSTVLLRKVLSYDEGHVADTLKWLANQQEEDGSFVEESLRKGEESQHVQLTSQVMISLLEASKNLHISEEGVKLIESVTKKSVEYIKKVILKGSLDKDAYSLNILAYALVLAKNDFVFDVLRRRNKLMIQKGDENFWRVEKDGGIEEFSLSVESTSYALLTSLAMSDFNDAKPFANFLLRRMKPDGVFVSSQDSYVALKALSQYFRLHSVYHEHGRVNIDVNLTLSNGEQVSFKVLSPFFVGSLCFDRSNLSLSSTLKVTSTGKGLLLFQSVCEFNEAVPSFGPISVDLKVEVKKKEPEHLQLEICIDNLELDPSPYLIVEVPLLSGYELNLEKHRGGMEPQVLKQDDDVYLIFHGVPPRAMACAELDLDRIHHVSRLERRFVKLYSPLEPDYVIRKPYGEP